MNPADVVKSSLQRVGVDIRRHRPMEARRQALLERLGVRTVIDVGANTGQYGRVLRAHGFRGGIVSFEPLPDAYDQLLAATAPDPGWTCHRLAASDRAGTAEMHRSATSPSSSLLPMADAHVAAAPDTAVVGTLEVPLARLDEVGEVRSAPGPLALKLDVQGHERTALAGATGLLPQVALVEAELSVRELYIGAPTMLEMLTYLDELGYELAGLEEGFHDPGDGQVLQYDGFFTRRDQHS